jgi:GxxExxY protein
MNENKISYAIRGCIFDVYNELGPGLLETVYVAALACSIKEAGYRVGVQLGFPVAYKDIQIDLGYRVDLLVEDTVIVEVKSVETLLPVHHKQLLTYLRISGLRLGLLVNFHTTEIQKNIFRKVNNLPDY